MKSLDIYIAAKYFLSICLLSIFLTPGFIIAQTSGEKGSFITGFEAIMVDFPKPIRQKGVAYNSAFVIHLLGQIEGEGGNDYDLYVGDKMITEWGGTDRGIYFFVYTEAEFLALTGDIQCRLPQGEFEKLGTTFSTDGMNLTSIDYADLSNWLKGP